MSATDSSQDTYSPPSWIPDASQLEDVAVCDTPASTLHDPIEPHTTSQQVSRKRLGRSVSARRQRARPQKPTLLQLADWDRERRYDEDPPIHLHYSIEWKVTMNGKMRWKDTEQDLVLAPASYWQLFLQPKLEELLRKKLPRNRCVRPDDTNVIVSVTDRSERDLVKQFDGLDIQRSLMESRLVAWSELYQTGKKLRVDLSFNYTDADDQVTGAQKKGDKRGTTSSTRNMLTERAAQLDAEQEVAGQASVWREVYNLMRCPGPPCHLGPHCWRDPVGKKHYKLRTHHLRSLIRYVEQGAILQSHEDVPEEVREQLYAEEQQRFDRKQPAAAASALGIPPITINNVLPEHPAPGLVAVSQLGPVLPLPSSSAIVTVDLEIPGHRDVAVREYSDWQQSQVHSPRLKNEFRKARDTVLAEGLDLEQVHKDQDSDFLVEKGVKRGIARRFVGDVEIWVKRSKRDSM